MNPLRSALVASLLALAVTFGASSTRAQSIPTPPASPPSAADAATAKKHFDSGLKPFGEGAFAEALIAFESSYKLGGRPSALRNIAQCHRNLRHVVEAYEAYEQMLALHEAQLTPADKAVVKQALDELGLLTVTVTVNVEPAGAKVEIDGKPVGTAPLAKPKRVLVGSHRVRVTKEGFDPFDKPLETRSGESEKVDVKLTPERAVGRLVVREQRGRDVRVFVDDVDRGPAPWEGDLDAGDHTVELRGQKFGSEKRSGRVARGERLDLVLEATPLDGRLRITTVPASARIELDGRTVGTGAWDGDVPPGNHVVMVTAPGAPPVVRQLHVERGETLAQEIPVAVAVTAPPPPETHGVYARLTAFPAFWLNGAPENASGGASMDGGGHIGLGGSLRVGYALDVIGFELVGTFLFEHKDEHLNYPNGNTKYDMNGPNVFVGAGARVTSRDQGLRFTFGLAPGVSIRSFPVNASQNSNNPSCNTGPNSSPCNQSGDQGMGNPGYTTIGFAADGGMLVGSTPGTKFFLGMHAFADVTPSDVIAGPDTRTPSGYLASPGGGYKVANAGLQLVVGPVLGIQFGQ